MPIRRFLDNGSFSPDEISMLVGVFEDALRELRLVDRNDPAANLVAQRIVELAKQGQRDPALLRDRALKGP